MLPFLYADTHMAPAGARAVGSAMVEAGFPKTRIVLQQWNRNFRPSRMRLDGRLPDIFMISSMQIHWAPCRELIRDVCRIEPDRRPLVIVGGPKVIYEPWDVFGPDADDPWSADVAVTGEEFVLLSLLEAVLSERAGGESVRSAFLRARDKGALDGILGLVYARGREGSPEELVDTGIQRLLGDLDELPHPVHGYGLLEQPSSRDTLASRPLAANKISRRTPIASLVLTLGCKFGCEYCPIPAYNQRQYRCKSGERVAEEIARLYRTYRLRFCFGADDNFFNDPERTLEIGEALLRRAEGGSRPHRKTRLATEATIHDTLRMKEHLPMLRRAGLYALWLGVEDMSGNLVRKGQSANETVEAFRLLRENGILPVPMMMHHDEQPLISRNGNAGLLNQLGVLRKAGALYMQITMLTPSPGSKLYVGTYTSGLAYRRVDGVPVEPHIVDGNHVVASNHPKPWTRQLNLILGYLYFYNPLRMLWAFVRPKTRIPFADLDFPPAPGRPAKRKPLRSRLRRKFRTRLGDAAVQVFGMWGLTRTIPRAFRWFLRLRRGRIERTTAPPMSRVPMRSPDGGPAAHALPGTPGPSSAEA